MARTYTLASGVATGYRIWPPSGNVWTFQASSATNAGPAYSTDDPLDIRELDKDSRLVGDGTPGTFVPPETPQVVRVRKSTGELFDEDGDALPVEKRAPSVEVERDATGRPIEITVDGVTETYTRDATGRVASFTSGTISRTVTRDGTGRLLEIA